MKNQFTILIIFVAGILLFFSQGDVLAQGIDSNNSQIKQTVIESVVFVGLEKGAGNNEPWFDESDIQKSFRENHIKVFKDDPFDPAEIEKAVESLKELFEVKGYLDAKISVTDQQTANNAKTIVFSIQPGAITYVTDVRFIGNKIFTNEELLENLKECSSERFDTFERERYEYYLRKCLLPFMQSKGYLKARFGDLQAQRTAIGLSVTIPIEEGIRYRVRQIKITGATAFSNEQIVKMLAIKSGDVANGKTLLDSLYENGLKKAYEEKGFIQYDVDWDPDFIEPTADQTDGIVNYRININEGRAFKVLKIQFIGVDKQTSRFLRGFINIQDGEIFKKDEFTKGIKAINETNSFVPLDAEKDVEIATDGENDFVQITVKVRKS